MKHGLSQIPLAAALLLPACSSSDEAASGSAAEAPPAAAKSAPAAAQEPDESCHIRYDDKCYADEASACAAADCAIQQCSILETSPGKVSCQLPGSSEHAANRGDIVALIAESSGPDDGGGYEILVGRAGGPAGWTARVGGLVGQASCRARVASHLSFDLAAKNQLADGQKVIELAGDDRLVIKSCESADSCTNLKGGSVTIDSFQPGVGAKGSYELKGPDGPLKGSFEASWCGPTSFAKP